MGEYVLNLGIVAFISWSQFAFWLSIVLLYTTWNIVPAILCAANSIHGWKSIPSAFDNASFMLIPLIGSLEGCHYLEDEGFPMWIAEVPYRMYIFSFFWMIADLCVLPNL